MYDPETIKEFVQCRPVDDVKIRSAVQALWDENQRLKTALTTSKDNQRRYSGQVLQELYSDATCACGETVIFKRKQRVPWSVIKDMLLLIQKNAGIT